MVASMSLGLLALCALLACAAASHPDRLAGVPFTSNRQVCESCFWMQASVHAYDAHVATRARFDDSHPAVSLTKSAFVDSAAANALVADALSAPLGLMRNSTQAVCALGDACELVMAEQLAENKFGVAGSTPNDDFGCPLCEFLMTNVKQTLIADPKIEQDLVAKAHTLCAALEPSVAAECIKYVDEYMPAAFKWVQDIDIQGACTMLGACKPADGQPAFPVVREVVGKLAAAAMLPAAANDNCDSCKMVVLEAAAMLKNPETQLAIMNEAKQACQFLQQYQAQCTQYVDMYGPMVLQLAQQYLQPDLLCVQLGFCPPVPAPPSVIVQ